MSKVGILGIGIVPARALSSDVSYRELIFEAAVKAYEDAGIEPFDVDTFVSVSEDFNEGVSIFDEYVPDQLGAVLKPVHTISGDGLYGVISVAMQIMTGMFRIGVVEAHSKASNVLNHLKILELALDPVYLRHTGVDPRFLAGLEMRAYMEASGIDAESVARAATHQRTNAIWNPLAAYPGKFSPDDVLLTEVVAEPLTEGMVAQPADGAVVVVLASEDVIRSQKKNQAVWIEGMGFYTSEPSFDTWVWERATYAELSARKAYEMAGISCPSKEISFAEVDSRYAYKMLQHIEACALTDGRNPAQLLRDGFFSKEGTLPVNLSGAHMGIGMMEEATALYQLAFAADQLLGRAGRMQLSDPYRCIIQSWRGLPTRSGATCILSRD